MILLQDCSSHLDSSINMATRGWGLFSLYICIENFKNLLIRNHWTDFHIILQKCFFGDPLPRLLKPFGFVKKHGCQGGRGLVSLYIYIENLKKSSYQKPLEWCNIMWQKCSFGNTVPRLFKLFGFVKKHRRQGAGLIFSIYLNSKTWKIFLSETTARISL